MVISMEYKRSERVEELVREILAEAILRELSDSFFTKVTITKVKMTPDLRHATVYVSALGPRKRAIEARDRLTQVGSFLRHIIGRDMHLKYLPELHFEVDTAIEQGMRIDKILKKISREQDEI